MPTEIIQLDGACPRYSRVYTLQTMGLWPLCSKCGHPEKEHPPQETEE